MYVRATCKQEEEEEVRPQAVEKVGFRGGGGGTLVE